MRKLILTLAAAFLLLECGILAAEPKQATAATAKAEVKPAAKVDFASIPQSKFYIPATTRDGRNPFFPNTAVVTQAPISTNAPAVADTSVFVLNGITGPPLRSAMINGRTFLQGEEGEVRLNSGVKVLIKCSEIGDEKAVIEIAGTKRELRLRLGI